MRSALNVNSWLKIPGVVATLVSLNVSTSKFFLGTPCASNQNVSKDGFEPLFEVQISEFGMISMVLPEMIDVNAGL